MVWEPSRRSKDIPPFIVMDVLERAQLLEPEGRAIVHMEVGICHSALSLCEVHLIDAAEFLYFRGFADYVREVTDAEI